MISTAEALENALAPATEPPKAATKVRGRQTCAHCRAEEGEGGEEGHPRQEGAQKREESSICCEVVCVSIRYLPSSDLWRSFRRVRFALACRTEPTRDPPVLDW